MFLLSRKKGLGFDDVRAVLVLTGEVRLENGKSLSILLKGAETLLSSELHAADTQSGDRRQTRAPSTCWPSTTGLMWGVAWRVVEGACKFEIA